MKIGKTTNFLLVVFLFFLIFLIFYPHFSNAAALYFLPEGGSYNLGTNFSVSIYVSSVNQPINAISGIIYFPKDKIEVVSLSKNDSILTFWVQEPQFSNSEGIISFEGIVMNPGFSGPKGKVLSITFKPKKTGSVALNFQSGSVLANDGKGTEVLSDMKQANFEIKAVTQEVPERTIFSEVTDTLAAPVIISPTHPDPNKWYALKNAKFSWDLVPEATALRLIVGSNPNAIPTTIYTPPIKEKEFTNLNDGIWYFSVQLRNNKGWGAISRFRFQIDTTKPDYFEINEIERIDLTEPKVGFIFDASDKLSGIDHYEIQIDNGNWQIWYGSEDKKYETPILEPGKHMLIAKALDKAGNFLVNFAEFTVEALESPVITDYPKQLSTGELLTVKGKTRYQNAQINFYL